MGQNLIRRFRSKVGQNLVGVMMKAIEPLPIFSEADLTSA
jgi:hypothetical protein